VAKMGVDARDLPGGDGRQPAAVVDLLHQAELKRVGSRRRTLSEAYLYPSLTFVGIVLAWQLVSTLLNVPHYLLPPPTDIGRTMVEQQPLLWEHSLATLGSILGGFALSIAVGIPVSMLIVYSKHFERSVYPLIVASQTIPKAAVAPLFVVWFGFGMLPKIVVAFLIAFFPILIASVVGLKSTPIEMVQLLRCMGSTERQVFLHARFPHALPSIFGGLKVGITLAVVGAVVGEFVGADKGLGYLIQVAQGIFDSDMLFAALTQLSLIGIVLFLAVWGAERLVLPPHRATT
jgi:NitT/TauT family transport system permease protein